MTRVLIFVVVAAGLTLAALSGYKWLMGSRKEGSALGHRGSEAIRMISADELQQRMEANKNIAVVNVLSPEMYKDCHIEGSINVKLDELATQAERWGKEDEIVVYCASYECKASAQAYQMLTEAGFTNVFAYEGGTKEWKQMGKPCVGPCEKDYLK